MTRTVGPSERGERVSPRLGAGGKVRRRDTSFRGDLAQIGEPFHATKGEARGLGLLNVRTTVEVVHEREWVPESELGVGAKMRIVVLKKQKARGKR